jgi:branched-chain amino acid transport system ATP-binding protein
MRPGYWDVKRVYDVFPRLAERQKNRGDQLSGGEQQMLAQKLPVAFETSSPM